MQLGPDRLPDAITLELAKDVVDSRSVYGSTKEGDAKAVRRGAGFVIVT
jgi:hypothetical protein